MNQSDEELIAAVAAGDREAFGALYRRRRPDVYRFALHMTGAPATAEDVAQEVFLTVIHDARAVCARAARRSSRGCWASRGTMRGGGSRSGATSRCRSRAASPACWWIRPRLSRGRGRSTALRQALGALPVPYREAVVLCDLQELSYQDAAVAAGCAIGTVRSRLHRGRQLLASKMRGERHAFAGWPLPGWM